MPAIVHEGPYDVVLARGLKVTARDGTRLSVDLYRPAREGEPLPGPFPAVVTRSPYDTRSGKGPSSQSGNGEFFARHGYIYAVQDSRGRFESEGEFVLLDQEGPDGYDVIEWLAGRPYCDGNVGTQGSSLRAWNQNATALERPPHLRAMWINQGGSNGLTSALRHNGAFELRWMCWAVTNAILSQEALRDPELQIELVRQAERMEEWLQRLPWTPGNSPLSALPAWERWLLDLYTHAGMSPFWANRSRNFELHRDETAPVPTMYAGSWYDSYARASVENYLACAARLDNQFLLMGAGVHGGPNFDRRMSGEVDMGPAAPIRGNLARSRRHLMLGWSDRWLKGDEAAFDTSVPVRYFRMGGDGGRTDAGQLRHGGRWFAADRWPPRGTVTTDLYLTADGGLAALPPETEGGKTSFVFDPEAPMPTVAGNVSSMTENLPPFARMMRPPDPITLRRSLVLQGAADQIAEPSGDLARRADAVAFETAPLDRPLEVTGTPVVEIHLSSDAPDTDIFAMLQDIHPPSEIWPDGYRLNICDSLMRVRFRNGFEKAEPMRPGKVVRVRFPLYPTSNLFAAGHRLRLLISSSSFPRFDVNPNTGEPIGRHTGTRVARNSIHHDATYPSRLILPLGPERRRQEP